MNYFIDALSWAFSADHWSGNNSITQRLIEHLWFTLMIVAISSVLAIPTGIVIGHIRRGAGLIGALTGAARAIPTLRTADVIRLVAGHWIKSAHPCTHCVSYSILIGRSLFRRGINFTRYPVGSPSNRNDALASHNFRRITTGIARHYGWSPGGDITSHCNSNAGGIHR